MREDRDALIGRRPEIQRLEEMVDAARNGHGRLVLLSGEAGVGKSRLADAVFAQNELTVCVGRAREELSIPYGPVTAALRERLRRSPGLRDRFGPLAGYLPMLLPELGPAPERAGPEILIEALIDAWVAAARLQPAVLFVEDLHWADHATIELLVPLAERIATEPLLVLATYRGDDIARGHPVRRLRSALRRARLLHEIALEPMSRDETAILLERALGAAPCPTLVQMVFDKTLGVPLYIEELAEALRAGGQVEAGDDGLRLVPGAPVPIPESIAETVLVRLDGLPLGARRLAEIAAVAGMEFDLEMVAALADGEEGIEELFDARLIVGTESRGGAFRQALIREAILEQVSWSRRRSLNRRIAAYMDRAGAAPELVAEHWLAAHELDPARRALLEVADRSCRVHAYRDAARAAARALEIWPEGVDELDRLDALSRLAHCAQATGQLADAVRVLREVVDSADETARRAGALRQLATVYELQGSWDLALETRSQSAQAYEATGEPAEAALEWIAVAGRHTARGHLDAALRAARRAVTLADDARRTDVRVRAKALEGNLLAMLGAIQEGHALAQEALSLALGGNHPEAASEAYRRLASVLDYCSDFTGSRDAYASAVAYCRDQGDDDNARVCLGCMSAIVFRTGEWTRALEICREVVEDRRSAAGSSSLAHGIAGLIRAARGEVRPARRALSRAGAIALQNQFAFGTVLADFGLAILAELEGNDQEATRLHQGVIDAWRETQDRHDLVPFFLWQSTFFGRRGRELEATQRAEALATMASGTANPESMAALAHALGEVSLLGGDAPEAASRFAQAHALIEKLDIPLEDAITSWRLGSTLLRQGAHDEAARYHNRALRIARNLGARAIASLMASEWEESGGGHAVGRRDDLRKGEVVTLTTRQQEIVRLMSDGLTNKEIASKLFVSPRTVDMHVSHILDRLDCRTRTEAVRKAGELGLLP